MSDTKPVGIDVARGSGDESDLFILAPKLSSVEHVDVWGEIFPAFEPNYEEPCLRMGKREVRMLFRNVLGLQPGGKKRIEILWREARETQD